MKFFFFISLFSFSILAQQSSSQFKKEDRRTSLLKADSRRQKNDRLEIDRAMAQMTTEEKIGQLFIVRTHSDRPLEEALEVFMPGGFIHSFKSETDYEKQFKKIGGLKKASLEKTNFISLHMVDQEGGTVDRLKNLDFNCIIAPLKLANINNLKLVEDFSFEIGRLLYSFGINMNLAPVVDVYNPQIKGYIRGRSFSSNPYQVQKVSRAVSRGLQKAGIIAVFKHFPGYSNAKSDSHKELVKIPSSKKELLARDLIPYQFKKGLSYPKAVMSNIALYPELDKDYTAPLSKKIITGILKEELGYKGLIITDDIGMTGYKEPDFIQRAVKAVQAGNDMLLASAVKNDQVIEIYQGMVQAFKKGVISKERVDESLRKILTLKRSLLPDNKSNPERLQAIEKHKKKICQISSQINQAWFDFYFKTNPHLKKSLSKTMEIISFSKNSYKLIEGLNYFENHKKNFNSIRAKEGLPDSSLKKALKLPLPGKNQLYFCYDKAVKYCHRYFTKKHKKRTFMIDTGYKPLLLEKEANQYYLYIPTYGFFKGVGEMILKEMIKPAPSSKAPAASS